MLPSLGVRAIGGYKVVYEYANRLARRGWPVTVVHPWWPTARRDGGLVEKLRRERWLRRFRPQGGAMVTWFDLDPAVEVVAIRHLGEIPRSDIYVATAWQTAAPVAEAQARTGHPELGLYLVQHYEAWNDDAAEVEATWELPLRKIAIARWIAELIDARSPEPADVIPNAIDHDAFGLDVPIDARPPRSLAALAHERPWKGTSELAAALAKVKQRDEALTCTMFGVVPRPEALPEWVGYEQSPDQRRLREIYNNAAGYVQASWSEGWGLPATEAMACGAALVTTDNGGSAEYAVDGETAIVCAPRSADALAEAIARLFEDDSRRQAIAATGHERVRRLSWEAATDALEAILTARAIPRPDLTAG